VFNGLFADRIGWRNVVMIACAPGLVVGTVMLFYHRIFEYQSPDGSAESDHGRSSAERRGTESRAIDPVMMVATGATGAKPRVRLAADGAARVPSARRVLLFFFASIVLRTITSTAIMNFMPTFLAEGVGLDVSIGAFGSGLLFVGAIISNTFSGDLADRYGPEKVLLGSSILAGCFVIAATLGASVWMLPLSLLALGASISAAIPAQNLVLSRLTPSGKKGATFGTLMGVMTIANSLGPLALGAAADAIGLAATFRLAATPVVVSCALVVIVARSREFRSATE
jgi:MFS family permease